MNIKKTQFLLLRTSSKLYYGSQKLDIGKKRGQSSIGKEKNKDTTKLTSFQKIKPYV